jgi:hypothetical protein
MFASMLAALHQGQPGAGPLIPAFATAAAAAADGRDAVLDAPSLPLADASPPRILALDDASADILADAIAGAAGTLSTRLAAAAAGGHGTRADAAALTAAARHAAAVRSCFAAPG